MRIESEKSRRLRRKRQLVVEKRRDRARQQRAMPAHTRDEVRRGRRHARWEFEI